MEAVELEADGEGSLDTVKPSARRCTRTRVAVVAVLCVIGLAVGLGVGLGVSSSSDGKWMRLKNRCDEPLSLQWMCFLEIYHHTIPRYVIRHDGAGVVGCVYSTDNG